MMGLRTADGLSESVTAEQVLSSIMLFTIIYALAVLNIPRAMHFGKPGYAFFSSSMVILALALLFSVAIFPNFLLSTIDPEYSVTLQNVRSSHATLQTMLIIALIGMPCVISYTVIIYWIFRGKVQLDPHSY